MDWVQLGEDFRQKYEGTFCRYVSPLTKQKEVFSVLRVRPNVDRGPDISLHNDRAGELFLNYATDAELDFSFPEVGNFQHGDKTYRFQRRYDRQWKKGICPSTGHVDFPYNNIHMVMPVALRHDVLESAFAPRRLMPLSEALALLNNNYFSVVLSPSLSVGIGPKEDTHYLWFQSEPIGLVERDIIQLKVKQFKQEITDYLWSTRDYGRSVI